MEGGEGMVAVVRGIRDSGLAVTLMDGDRQYTLMPSSVNATPTETVLRKCCAGTDMTCPEALRCDSSAQATDGRYASIYQVNHCNVIPTSPPMELTEFPPQKAELCPGHENFEVGGAGSGETYFGPGGINGATANCRGAMSLPGRGSACSPRPSREPSAFANSLRKYPLISSERSSEIVERLITYTQAKHMLKNQLKYISPVRTAIDPEVSIPDRYSARNSVINQCQKPKNDESPTRESRSRRSSPPRVMATGDCPDYRRYKCDCRNYADIPRRTKQNMNPYNTNSVNTEIQAVVKMVSKEVATVPRAEPAKKNVAVPLSPATSSGHQRQEGQVSEQLPSTSQLVTKSAKIKIKSVQTTTSSIELLSSSHKNKPSDERRTKSEEELRRRYFTDGILELLGNMAGKTEARSNTAKLHEKILRDMSVKLKKYKEKSEHKENTDNSALEISKKFKTIPVLMPIEAINDLSGELLKKPKKKGSQTARIYRAEICPFRINNEENNLEDIIKNWVSDLPIKDLDFIGKPVEKIQVTDTLIRRISKLFSNNARFMDMKILKQNIIGIISDAPLELRGYNKSNVINRLADIFITKICDIVPQPFKRPNNYDLSNDRNYYYAESCNEPREEELIEIITNELIDFQQIYKLDFSTRDSEDIIAEIAEIFIEAINKNSYNYDEYMRREIVIFLSEYGLSAAETLHFANKLLDKFVKHFKIQTRTHGDHNFLVYRNNMAKSQKNATPSNKCPDCNKNTPKSDVNMEFDKYMNDLCSQINEWLTSLPVEIPKAHEKGYRQVVVNDLAGDIIDRQKYLQFNPSSSRTETDELEHLKYQIFKWVNKLFGEENLTTIEHAADLMQRVKGIPVPILTISKDSKRDSEFCQTDNENSKFNTNNYRADMLCISTTKAAPSHNNFTHDEPITTESSNIPLLNPISKPNCAESESSQAQKYSLPQQPSFPPQSCCSRAAPVRKTLKQLNEEYDAFVRNWVQQIPISTSCPKDQEIAEKARMGIYNGIWKAITKLKFDPAALNNRFYYQDILDNEIEDLLDCLPKNDELDSKKHLLKVQLLEKTTNTNDLMRNLAETASFRQELAENVANNIYKGTVNDRTENPYKLKEDIQILSFVEDFILCKRFKEDDLIKANVYRKKLLSSVEAFVKDLKKTHGKELENIDMELYINDILKALHSVPLPSEDIIKEEAQEIMIGIEIEQWFSDLPIIPNNDYIEHLQRRRLRELLTKKILELQKNQNLNECASKEGIKQEIKRFLEKLPLQQREGTDFMVEELVNRLKNLEKDGGRRKSVVFQDPVSYVKFVREMQHHSSYSDQPNCCHGTVNEKTHSNCEEIGSVPYHPMPTKQSDDAVSITAKMGNCSGPPIASIDMNHEYPTFDQSVSITSSPHAALGHYIPTEQREGANIQQNRKQSEPKCLTSQESKSAHAGQSTCNSGKVEQLQSAAYVDRQSLGKSHHTIRNNQSDSQYNACCSMNQNNLLEPQQMMQEQVLKINQIAVGHAPMNQTCHHLNGQTIKTFQEQPLPVCPTAVIHQSQHETLPPFTLYNQHQNIQSNPIDQATLTSSQIPRNPCSPKIVIQEFGSQSVSTLSPDRTVIGSPQQTLLHQMACAQQPNVQLSSNYGVTLIPEGTTQPIVSSYGQPQGFSTPHHENVQSDVPPKVEKKRHHETSRSRRGLARRKLEQDDSEVDDSDDEYCPCIERFMRIRRSMFACEECFDEYPCFYPMMYPYPFF